MNAYKKKIKEWYDKTAKRYDSWGMRSGENCLDKKDIEGAKFDKFLRMIPVTKKTKVLDIASGTGKYLIKAMAKGAQGYAIDISDKMLQEAKKKISALGLSNRLKSVKNTDAEHIPFPKEFFDIVFCMGMLEYYPEKTIKSILMEIHRVAKPKALCIIDFPNKNNKKTFEFQKKEREVGHEVYIYSLSSLKIMIEQAGFQILEHQESGIEVQFMIQKNCTKSFAEKVYSLTKKVPKGRITTYGKIAKSMKTKAYRAVGHALHVNPYAPIVPCHRVVNSDGRIGGFASGTKKKIEMLKKEGIAVKKGKIIGFRKKIFRLD